MTDGTDPDDGADAGGAEGGDADPDVQIPEDEAAVIAMLGEDATEQEKNVAIAQAELIGDI